VVYAEREMLLSFAIRLALLCQAPAEAPPAQALVKMPAHLPQAIAVAFSPDGKWMATSGANSFVSLRDPTNGEIKRVLTGHPGLVHEVAFSPDSKLLASAGAEGIAILWSVERGEKVLALQALTDGEGTARTVAFCPDGRLLATGASDGSIKVWDIIERKLSRQLPRQRLPVTSVKFAPNGKLLATATGNWRQTDLQAELRLWDVSTGKEVAEFKEHAGEIKRIDFDQSGKRLISGGADRAILTWDIAERVLVNRFRIDATPGCLAVFQEGTLLATGDLRGGVNVWNLQNGKRIRRYAGHERAVLGIAVRPDGAMLATASHDGTIRLWPAAFPADTARGGKLTTDKLPAEKAD
jgi:WD40 repeat protein